MSPELQAALDRAGHWWKNASDAEKKAMIDAQRESWIRAMAPCEHGDPDWETCPECLARIGLTPHAPPLTPPPDVGS